MKIDIGTIDWVLLRKQKETLLEVLNDPCMAYLSATDMQGILGLIDHIQDEAAKQLGDEAVFGPEEKEE